MYGILERTIYESMSDDQLVNAARSGAEEAENELLERYKSVVRQKAASYYMAGADSEDLIQEGMIGVFKAMLNYDGTKGASFATFANMCIKRQLISAVKSASCKKHRPLNNSVSLSNPLSEEGEGNGTLVEMIESDSSTDPERRMLFIEEMKLIEDDGQALFTDLEKAAWNMYLDGCSYNEIAEKLDRTRKAVDNAIRRAKNKLANLLETQENDM